MRVRPWVLAVLGVFELVGLAIYVMLLGEQAPVNLSTFCIADMLVTVCGKSVYSLFLIGPVVFGTALCIGENRDGMSVVLWQSKRRLARSQMIFCSVWSMLLAVIAVVVPLVCGSIWGKVGMNWESNSSYFAIVNHIILPDIALWEVIIVNLLVQWTRNLIFAEIVLLSYWWNGGLLYGILVSACIGLIELKLPQIKIILGLVKADYVFWLSAAEKVFAVLAGAGWILFLNGMMYYLRKGKEFL